VNDEARLAHWQRDPVAFAEEVLGLAPWSRQRELFYAVRDHDFVAVRSGHKVGKSTSAAALALWRVVCFPWSRVVLTAPSDHQLEQILWPEVCRLYEGARCDLGGRLYESHQKGLRFAHHWGIFGLSTNKHERFSGLSSPRLFFIVDEASGYPEDIYDAVFGNMAGGGKALLTGNPTQTSGTFYDAFRSKRGSFRTLHISSLESPNLTGEAHIPGLATPEWVAWATKHWGGGKLEGPTIDVRVKGNFPEQGDNAVVSLLAVEEALARWDATKAEGNLEIGVDPARFGDDETVLYPRRGRKVLEPVALKSLNTTEIAGKVLELCRGLYRPGDRPRVKVDAIGIGAGVVDQLDVFRDLDVVGVNVAEAALDEEHYHNLRAQIWFAARDFLRDGGALPPHRQTEADLLAPTYSFDGRGRYVVESKDQIKRRLKRSPDHADALCLDIYSPPVVKFSGAGKGVIQRLPGLRMR
jgi:phage terminase large subunit